MRADYAELRTFLIHYFSKEKRQLRDPALEQEDAIQETLLKFLEFAQAGRCPWHNRSKLAFQAFFDMQRSEDALIRARVAFDLTAAQADPEPPPEARVIPLLVAEEHLAPLTPRLREIFLLKKAYGYSQREIARELGVAEHTVEAHLFRSSQLLPAKGVWRR
jgi:DNA-directed RNA polymerase specialized sigma24 family protein